MNNFCPNCGRKLRVVKNKIRLFPGVAQRSDGSFVIDWKLYRNETEFRNTPRVSRRSIKLLTDLPIDIEVLDDHDGNECR